MRIERFAYDAKVAQQRITAGYCKNQHQRMRPCVPNCASCCVQREEPNRRNTKMDKMEAEDVYSKETTIS